MLHAGVIAATQVNSLRGFSMKHCVRLRKTSLVAATLLALTCSSSYAAVPVSVGLPDVAIGQPTALNSSHTIMGRVAASEPLHIVVALKLRNAAALDSFIAGQQSPVTTKPQAMSAAQLAAQHLPTSDQAKAVAAFLRGAGFSNVEVADNRLLVSADATAATVQAAFATNLVYVQTPDGRRAYANNDAVHIPSALQDSVLSVIGLQTVYQAHTMLQPASGVTPKAITGHNPNEFTSIYGGSGQTTGAGVTVGIITQGSLTNVRNDLNSFTAQNGLATVLTQTVQTGATSTDTSGDGEWDLDSQDIVGMAGGSVGKLIFYNIPTLANTNLTADINTAVSRNEAKIINVSLGECETSAQGDGSAAAQDQSFATAVAQGQTFSISTGDSGADECGNGGTTPSWPAASQFVIAVAGTTLNASTTTWSSETVWAGSGGSQSTFEPKPSWQTLWTGPRRGVADVAFDGNPSSGARVIVRGATQQIGGTSLSAPLFSGLWARVIAAKGTAIGFAGPLIYQLPTSSFHDVTSGNNAGSTAAVGYDLASGRGSMIISSVLANVGGGAAGGTPAASFSFATNGLLANFTDSSTDTGGTITSHAWTFGDGGTSTATNPSHTYAAAGTFSVSETVSDSASGKSSTATRSVTVSSSGTPAQLLANTSFESTASWTATAGVICATGCTGQSAHTGAGFAWLDGFGTTHTDTLAQSVAITAGKTTATVSYFLHIDTAETTTATAFDKLTVGLFNSSGTLLQTLATYSNLNKAAGYTVHTHDVSAFIGQTVTLKFTGTEDSSLQTSFVVDDVTLTVQ